MIIHVRPVTLQGRNRRFRDKTPFRARILARSRSWRARKGCPGRQDAAECWLNCGTLDVCYASKSFTNIELHPSLTRKNEAIWEQQIRNIRSHHNASENFIQKGYLKHVPKVDYRITNKGRKYLENDKFSDREIR